jgi:hypothetical protein
MAMDPQRRLVSEDHRFESCERERALFRVDHIPGKGKGGGGKVGDDNRGVMEGEGEAIEDQARSSRMASRSSGRKAPSGPFLGDTFQEKSLQRVHPRKRTPKRMISSRSRITGPSGIMDLKDFAEFSHGRLMASRSPGTNRTGMPAQAKCARFSPRRGILS